MQISVHVCLVDDAGQRILLHEDLTDMPEGTLERLMGDTNPTHAEKIDFCKFMMKKAFDDYKHHPDFGAIVDMVAADLSKASKTYKRDNES